LNSKYIFSTLSVFFHDNISLKGDENIKLQKYLQLCGFARRKADEYITSKRVIVNGKTVDEPWFEVNEDDNVLVDGKILKPNQFEYYVLHKPKDYVTTLFDPKQKKTIGELIKHIKTPLKPAGRLDKDATGVLILTNDGELIDILTSAKYKVKKEYIVKVKGIVSVEKLIKLKEGIYDKGDFLKLEHFKIIEKSSDYSIVRVELIKGKKHEIKRLFSSIGHKVLELKRISHGPISISLVPNEGELRKIEGEKLKKLLVLKRIHVEK